MTELLTFLAALLAGAAMGATPLALALLVFRRPFSLGFQPEPSTDPRFLIGGQP